MKLSEKIQILRKHNGYSQEDLAVICNVSRQSISKWEADIALPETEKLIILSNLFQVTVDVLLKDELSINGIKEINTCGNNAIKKEHAKLFEGTLIKERSVMVTVTKSDLISLGYGPSFAADIIKEAKKLMIAKGHTYYQSKKLDRVPKEAVEELLGITLPENEK